MGSLGLCFRPLRLSSVHVRLARQCSDKIFVSACPPRTTVGGVKVAPFPYHVISRLRLYSAPAGKTATKKVSPSTPVKQRAKLAAERQTGSSEFPISQVHRHRMLITPFSFARATSDLPRRYWPYHFPGHVQGHKSLHRCFLLLCSGSRLRCWRPTRAGTYRLYASLPPFYCFTCS